MSCHCETCECDQLCVDCKRKKGKTGAGDYFRCWKCEAKHWESMNEEKCGFLIELMTPLIGEKDAVILGHDEAHAKAMAVIKKLIKKP